MDKQAISKYVRISPFKAREITRLIQGQPVTAALALVEFSPRKAARLVGDTLRSAVANAENDPNDPATRDELFVREAVIGEGPTMKRIRPKARGMAGRVRKRSSNIRIVVTTDKPNQRG
jgi:large subunit ribosomal protein L22